MVTEALSLLFVILVHLTSVGGDGAKNSNALYRHTRLNTQAQGPQGKMFLTLCVTM